jgi:hypothetical protein
MPALHASQSTARKAVDVVEKVAKSARISRTIADRCFLPAWGHVAANVPINKLNNNSNSSTTKRNFSSAMNHEFCIDYWKVHADEHVNLEKDTGKSPVIDYWKAHRDTHYDESASLLPNTKRAFSTNSRTSAATESELIDYWYAHNDQHLLDYWNEHPKSHL